MTDKIQEIEGLWETYETLSAERYAIIEQYERPTQWLKDERFIQTGKDREEIFAQINKLCGQIQDIKEAKIFAEKTWER
jgi:hypothetical protein